MNDRSAPINRSISRRISGVSSASAVSTARADAKAAAQRAVGDRTILEHPSYKAAFNEAFKTWVQFYAKGDAAEAARLAHSAETSGPPSPGRDTKGGAR